MVDASSHSYLEGARPTAEEQEIYDKVQLLLTQSAVILGSLSKYVGAGDEIRVVCSQLCIVVC